MRHEYNLFGQLQRKVIGGNIEKIDYDYIIRGWLLGTNRGFITDDSVRYFGYDLGYDKVPAIISGTSYAKSQLNGYINGIIWKSADDNKKRKFDFAYDAADRMTSAAFKQLQASGFGNPGGLGFQR